MKLRIVNQQYFGGKQHNILEERSPCLRCERLRKNKLECAELCEKRKMYVRKLPYFLLSTEDLNDFSIYHVPDGETID